MPQATHSPQQLQQLYQQLQQQVVDAELESAAETTLPQLLTALDNLPPDWTQSQDWVAVVSDVNDYLNQLLPELEQQRDEAQSTITKIGKSKKGVRAYTK